MLTPAEPDDALALFGAGEGRDRTRCAGCGRRMARNPITDDDHTGLIYNCGCGRSGVMCGGCVMRPAGPRCVEGAHAEMDMRSVELAAMNERIAAGLPVRDPFYLGSPIHWPETVVGVQDVEPLEAAVDPAA